VTGEGGADALGRILDGLQQRLQGELQGNRSALSHPGARGEASEDDWLRVLNDHLPRRYQADRAFVIDSTGARSDQIDIVVYDRQYSPFLYNQSDQRYVPSESVYAILEVKQDLSRENVLYAGAKAASVRSLKRTSAEIPYVEGIYRAREVPSIVAGIVAYQSSWSPPLGDALNQVLNELEMGSRLDLGCALTSGVFQAEYAEGEPVKITTLEGPRTLFQFFFRFLKQLQSLGTAPAIDYEAYLERFAHV
jgi:hypothetical protein